MLLTIDPREPEPWLVARAAQVLKRGGVAVLPTDTVYGIACAITHPAAIERIYGLKQLDPKKPLALLLSDVGDVGRFARGVSTPAYRLLRRVLPGPYTFIFQATPAVPKIMLRKRKTIGIRVPDSAVTLAILAEVGEPLLSTSVRDVADEFVNDPEEIEGSYGDRIDLVVDGGPLAPTPSTVVDLSTGEAVLVREGKGDIGVLELF